jgi:hypothetical protein
VVGILPGEKTPLVSIADEGGLEVLLLVGVSRGHRSDLRVPNIKCDLSRGIAPNLQPAPVAGECYFDAAIFPKRLEIAGVEQFMVSARNSITLSERRKLDQAEIGNQGLLEWGSGQVEFRAAPEFQLREFQHTLNAEGRAGIRRVFEP